MGQKKKEPTPRHGKGKQGKEERVGRGGERRGKEAKKKPLTDGEVVRGAEGRRKKQRRLFRCFLEASYRLWRGGGGGGIPPSHHLFAATLSGEGRGKRINSDRGRNKRWAGRDSFSHALLSFSFSLMRVAFTWHASSLLSSSSQGRKVRKAKVGNFFSRSLPPPESRGRSFGSLWKELICFHADRRKISY